MITLIFCSIAVLLLISISSIAEAIMDTVDFKFAASIFNQPDRETKIFEIRWNIWWNQSEGWKNKYHRRDPIQGIRTVYVLGISMPQWITEIISDSWHFFKMVKVLTERLAASLLFIIGTIIPTNNFLTIIIALAIFLILLQARFMVFEYSLKKLIK